MFQNDLYPLTVSLKPALQKSAHDGPQDYISNQGKGKNFSRIF